jgi:flagella basal body P-ring formation protein FlgA
MQQPVKHLSIALLAVLAAFATRTHAAETHQSLEDIRSAVSDFALAHHGHDEQVKVTAASLDQRLRLQRCAQPLDVFWAPGSGSVGNTTVGVRCAGSRPWKLYVPARISKMANVAVAARALTRGHRLGPDDLRQESRDLATVSRDAVRDPQHVRGYVMRRSAGVGRVIDTRMLSAPLLVERGQGVQLLSSTAGLQIRMTGVSLDDGSRGEMIRVRNPVSNRVVRARVVGSGRVELGARP